ncbi:MAG: hypothetical protein ACJ72M_07255, partial [Propionibacteriaceae bacterium]
MSVRSGDGGLRFTHLVPRFDRDAGSVHTPLLPTAPVQDSERGALLHRISDRPVLARSRGQALSGRTRRFASSLVPADSDHSIAGAKIASWRAGPTAVWGPASARFFRYGAEARS